LESWSGKRRPPASHGDVLHAALLGADTKRGAAGQGPPALHVGCAVATLITCGAAGSQRRYSLKAARGGPRRFLGFQSPSNLLISARPCLALELSVGP
jgi:hypothetical protein